ncbi:MAG: hypothetical protein HY511_06470 [Actinobacteria bacterium]|nr:hypothetical protein [Actinomycetota bacterium]
MSRSLPRAVLALVAAAGAIAAAASADSVPFADDGALPWATGATVTSPLEGFAATVATRIAGRPVTIRCEGDTDWQKLARERGFDPSLELGYVSSRYQGGNLSPSDFSELSPSVCLYLQRFAAAATKPTKCSAPVTTRTTTYQTRRVKVRQRVAERRRVNGKVVTRWRYRTVWVTRRVPVTVERTAPGPAGACYVDGHAAAGSLGDAFWKEYFLYAQALLTLAHEAIHLSGVVGGRLSSGVLVGDQQAEAKAECYGLQWLPYVAEQFGAAADDARAIAAYAYDVVHPRFKGTEYWSPECRDGGALDLRPSSSVWP